MIQKIGTIWLCVLVMFSSTFFVIAEDGIYGDVELVAYADKTVVYTNKTTVDLNDSISLNFILKNVGNTMVRLLKISEWSALWLSIKDSNGNYLYFDSLDQDYTTRGIAMYGNDSLMELEPGENISIEKSIYLHDYSIIEAGYYTIICIYGCGGLWAEGTIPHWNGCVMSNEIEIHVIGNKSNVNEDINYSNTIYVIEDDNVDSVNNDTNNWFAISFAPIYWLAISLMIIILIEIISTSILIKQKLPPK